MKKKAIPELTKAQQERVIFILRKYLATVDYGRGKKIKWDLAKCDDETRAFFLELGISEYE